MPQMRRRRENPAGMLDAAQGDRVMKPPAGYLNVAWGDRVMKGGHASC